MKLVFAVLLIAMTANTVALVQYTFDAKGAATQPNREK